MEDSGPSSKSEIGHGPRVTCELHQVLPRQSQLTLLCFPMHRLRFPLLLFEAMSHSLGQKDAAGKQGNYCISASTENSCCRLPLGAKHPSPMASVGKVGLPSAPSAHRDGYADPKDHCPKSPLWSTGSDVRC